MEHDFNREEFDKRRKAKEDLKKPHTPPNSIQSLRERIELIEKMLGI